MAVVDLYLVYEFIKRLATPFEEWEAYERGIIDEEGNILMGPRERRRNIKDRQAFGKFDLLVLKLKKLLEKIPGGQSRLGSYAAALWLVKEHVEKGKETLTEQSLVHYMTLAEDLDVNGKFENYLDETMGVGAGTVDGIGVGPKGEPGITAKQMNKYKKKNRAAAVERFTDMWK